jgi:hypothetical protein
MRSLKRHAAEPAKPMTPAEQRRRFEETARELDCDQSEEAFDAALRTIARHKPKPPDEGEPMCGASRTEHDEKDKPGQ